MLRQQPRMVLRTESPTAPPTENRPHHEPTERIQKTNQKGTAGSLNSLRFRKNEILRRMKERMTEEKALLLIAGVDAALKKCDFNYEDKATYQLLQRGDTDGIFFLEGAFNQFDLCQLKPSNLQQLTAACAFSHPLTNDLIYKYLKNREIRSDGDYYGIPEVDEVLRETNGIVIYKQQADEITSRLDKLLEEGRTELEPQAGFIKEDLQKHWKWLVNRDYIERRAKLVYRLAYIKVHLHDEFMQLYKSLCKEESDID